MLRTLVKEEFNHGRQDLHRVRGRRPESAWRGLYTFEGKQLQIIVVPHERLEEVRKRQLRYDGGLGEVPNQSISLGPRGGGCPCCNR